MFSIDTVNFLEAFSFILDIRIPHFPALFFYRAVELELGDLNV